MKKSAPCVFFIMALGACAWVVYALLVDHIGRQGVIAVVTVTALLFLTYHKGLYVLLNSALVACSLFFFSIVMFSFFEFAPGLISVFHLDSIPYYAARLNYIPDPILRKRNTPSFSKTVSNFRGSHYSPIYGIDVTPSTIEFSTDTDGFRNARMISSADIIVLGDSLIEYGDNQSDMFSGRLESLLGLTVRNLAVSGYGPNQYIEVLRQYGLKSGAKYALFGFYAGNDIADIREFAEWKSGVRSGGLDDVFSSSYWRRYRTAAIGVYNYLRNTADLAITLVSRRILKHDPPLHPDIAILDVGGKKVKELFFSPPSRRDSSVEEELAKWEWQEMKRIFSEIKELCLASNITPIIIYIPTAAAIYAKYSTAESGENWLSALKNANLFDDVTEKALRMVARQLKFEIISLAPAFDAAAKEGKLLYYALDSHWNSEGRKIAAEFVAETLKKKSDVSSRRETHINGASL